MSPFAYCSNNPINRIDPTGAWDKLVITGTESDAAVNQLQSSTTMKINRDSKTGVITATGDAKTENDKKLLSVINSTEITVNIEANDSKVVDYMGKLYGTHGGAFMGNTVSNNSTTSTIRTGTNPSDILNLQFDYTTVSTSQVVNPDMLEDFDIFAGTPGQAILHEITESYSGALISQKTGISALPAIYPNNSIYEQAHKAKTTVPQPGDGVITESDILRIRLTKTKKP